MINIAKILKNNPKKTKLYSPMFGDCKLIDVKKTIRVSYGDGECVFDQYGRFTSDGICLLFPSKDDRDWKKFAEQKCQFKPFDKVVARFDGGTWFIAFFSHYGNEMETYVTTGASQRDECLPYNEKTAKLIGTDTDYNE